MNAQVRPIHTLFPVRNNFKRNMEMIGDLTTDFRAIIDIVLIDLDDRNIKTKALIDTGAYYSNSNKNFFSGSNITSIKKVKQQAVGGKLVESQLIKCKMVIPAMNELVMYEVYIATSDFAFKEAPVILGVHFLSDFEFRYNHPFKGKFYLKYIGQ